MTVTNFCEFGQLQRRESVSGRCYRSIFGVAYELAYTVILGHVGGDCCCSLSIVKIWSPIWFFW